jgi:hypothetical protein
LGLSRPELEALLAELFGEVAALKQVVGEQREEIARLKGVKGRPTIRPSGMDKAAASSKSGKQEKRRGRGKVTLRVIIEDQVLKIAAPPGSRFKGHASRATNGFSCRTLSCRYARPVISASAG